MGNFYPPERRVVITGMGALTPIGNNVDEFWAGLMQKWINLTAALITAERSRGAAPETLPARDLATSLNLMNERMIMATLAGEPGAVAHDDVVNTLTHIWLNSIYSS